MEVSGQKQSKGKEMKLCSFCEDYDMTTCADGFCVECEVFTCNNCFDKHKGRKASRNHSLVNIEDSHSARAIIDDTFETCQYHGGKILELYCPKHDQVCCSECIVLKHNGCKLELVKKKAASFQSSSEFNSLTAMITKCYQQAQACVASMERNEQQLPNIYEKFLRDVNAFADEVIERVKRMKETLLIQAKNVMLKDEKNVSKVQKESEELIAELSRQNDLLKSKMGQPNKLFAASVAVKPELKKIEQQLNILQAKNVVIQYTFKRDEGLESTIKKMTRIGLLHAVEQKEEWKNTTMYRLLGLERKQQPLLDRQLFGKNVNVDGDIISHTPNEENEIGLYVDNRPLSVGSYFEIEVVSIGSRGSIALGFTHGDSSNLPAVEKITQGYHSDGRILKDRRYDKTTKTWSAGDRIGCKILNKYVFQAQFTHNGNHVGSGWAYASQFAVGMSSPGDKVKVILE